MLDYFKIFGLIVGFDMHGLICILFDINLAPRV